MSCDAVRDRLVAGEPARELADHLERCPACARFARRLDEVERLLGRPAGFEPDASFPARVAAALPAGPDLLGWAALRLMPAMLALALVLAGWCLLATPSPSTLLEPTVSDDPLAWVARSEAGEQG